MEFTTFIVVIDHNNRHRTHTVSLLPLDFYVSFKNTYIQSKLHFNRNTKRSKTLNCAHHSSSSSSKQNTSRSKKNTNSNNNNSIIQDGIVFGEDSLSQSPSQNGLHSSSGATKTTKNGNGKKHQNGIQNEQKNSKQYNDQGKQQQKNGVKVSKEDTIENQRPRVNRKLKKVKEQRVKLKKQSNGVVSAAKGKKSKRTGNARAVISGQSLSYEKAKEAGSIELDTDAEGEMLVGLLEDENVEPIRIEVELSKPLGIVVGELNSEVYVAGIEAMSNAARQGSVKVGDQVVGCRFTEGNGVVNTVMYSENPSALIESIRTHYGEVDSKVTLILDRKHDSSELETLENSSDSDEYGLAQFVAFQSVFRSFVNLRRAGLVPKKTLEYVLERAVDLMYSYSRQKKSNRILKLYRRLKKADVQLNSKVWNVFMITLLSSGNTEGAVFIFNEIPNPSVECFTTLIKVYGIRNELDNAVAVLQDIRRAGIKPTMRTYNALISAFVKCRQLEKATELFQEMIYDGLEPDTTSWNIILNWSATNYRGRKRLSKTFEWYENMKASGLQADVVTFTTLIKACVLCDEFQTAHELLDEMIQNGLKPDTETFNTMIDAYARRLQYREALDLFYDMKTYDAYPDYFTYARMIQVCAKSNQKESAELIMKSMCESKYKPTQAVYVSLLSMYADAGDITSVLLMLRNMQSKGVLADNRTMATVMNACVRIGNYELALSVYSKIKASGIQPDVVTYTLLMRAYGEKGELEKAMFVLNKMRTSSLEEQKPSVVTYNTAIELALRFDKYEVALDVIRMLLDAENVGIRLDRNSMRSIASVSTYRNGNTKGSAKFLLDAIELVRQRNRYPDGQVYCALVKLCEVTRDEEFGNLALRHRDEWFRISRRDEQLVSEVERRLKRAIAPPKPTTSSFK